jgi:hypothetical protein
MKNKGILLVTGVMVAAICVILFFVQFSMAHSQWDTDYGNNPVPHELYLGISAGLMSSNK